MVAPGRISRSRLTSAGIRRRCRFALLAGLYLLPAAPLNAPAQQPDVRVPDFETENPQLERLNAALGEYRRIAESGGWPSLPSGPTLVPDSTDPRISTLVTRLRATGDLPDDEQTFDAYDDTLQAAVRRFQTRHGLEPDALAGRATLRALNVPVGKRINQLCKNLTRAREVFNEQRRDFLLVNIPAFEATLTLGGRPIWTTNVIVGEKDAPTPLFESHIKNVIVNPNWRVPRSIAREELLPKIQDDIRFLSRGGYDVLDAGGLPVDPATVDWSALNIHDFPFRLVQRPGPQNELGRIKFLFPNPYGMCMHDTPSKYLFAYSSRAFSHGCIRMENPVDFAAQLLAENGWTRAQLDAQLASGKTLPIALAESLPIVIAYLTASADNSGTVFFYRDVYRRDSGHAQCPADS